MDVNAEEAELSAVEEARQGLLDELRRRPLTEVLEAMEDGTTPLLAAIREGHLHAVEWMVNVAKVDVEQVRIATRTVS